MSDMPIGPCCVCGEQLDYTDAGFCKHCGGSFCWAACGGWYEGDHTCNGCKEYLEMGGHDWDLEYQHFEIEE
uniref:Uncharacterized protein n=1 Tax=viral metagenome TaxID=1070528 RepID=A0A6M3M8B8_9ZZZZ